jgi:uncharacterized membrane protein
VSLLLWILQIVLAVVFLLAGGVKAFQSYDTLADRMPWVEDYSPNTVRIIGALEILGAIGLILPGLLGMLTILTPAAAIGLAVLMLLAIVKHIGRREQGQVIFTGALLVLLVIVAWGRVAWAPF